MVDAFGLITTGSPALWLIVAARAFAARAALLVASLPVSAALPAAALRTVAPRATFTARATLAALAALSTLPLLTLGPLFAFTGGRRPRRSSSGLGSTLSAASSSAATAAPTWPGSAFALRLRPLALGTARSWLSAVVGRLRPFTFLLSLAAILIALPVATAAAAARTPLAG